MIAAGDPCPDFTLPDDRGEDVAFAALKGRPFVLYFYPKDDTSGCTQEALDFPRGRKTSRPRACRCSASRRTG